MNIKHPIIQAPMLGITTAEMVSAISNEGGLGSLPAGNLSPEETLKLIRKTKELTSKPFAVNLFINEFPSFKPDQVEKMKEFIIQIMEKHKLPLDDFPPFTFHSYKEQIDLLIQEQIPIVSFTFGCIDDDTILKLQKNNIILIGTATCLKEAEILESKGIDYIVAQGIEAGGHRGTFLENEPLPKIGLFSLLTQMSEKITKPIIAAGGISDKKGIAAALNLGAKAVQIGTAFINSYESSAVVSYKNSLSEATDTDSKLTRAYSGRWARGIKNTFMEELEKSGLEIPPYPIQNILTSKMRSSASKNNNKDFLSLWSGQSVAKSIEKSAKDIFRELIE